ncbi:MAG TPA: AAA family ATPase, partial [Armatimonadaceae bacterium]|nr:AAA family ATPase [Armatimonadaceae bacterium]
MPASAAVPEASYLSVFTPGRMSHATLEAILVKRQALAESLVRGVAESVLTPAKHQVLLLGPRGMGKSFLVNLVYHRVREREELRGKVAVALCAEEEWGVASLADLYLTILRALDREYPDAELAARIDALYDLPLDATEGAAADLIREFGGEQRTLFLLVENLNEIFRGLTDQEQWALRSFLSERPFVTILATTPSLFDGVNDRDRAFYG